VTIPRTDAAVSRRVALAGLGAGGLGATLAATAGHAAQEGAGDLAAHPLVGTWAVQTPGGVVPQTHGPDGSVVVANPPSYVDPALGLTFQGPALGRWEADGDRGFLFTAINALSDADGAYVGSFLLAAAGEVGEDGQTWGRAGREGRIVVRDAANNVVLDEALPAELVVTATRMGATAESVVLPVATPAAGTPTA
jgi:hypothetical protein